MIPAGRVDWPCILSSSNRSTDDDAMVFEGEYCLTLKTGLMSPANEIKDRSAETFDLRLSPVLTTVTTTPLSTRGAVEVLPNKK